MVKTELPLATCFIQTLRAFRWSVRCLPNVDCCWDASLQHVEVVAQVCEYTQLQVTMVLHSNAILTLVNCAKSMASTSSSGHERLWSAVIVCFVLGPSWFMSLLCLHTALWHIPNSASC